MANTVHIAGRGLVVRQLRILASQFRVLWTGTLSEIRPDNMYQPLGTSLKKDNKMEQFVTKENKRKPTHKQHICNSHKPTRKPKITKELFFAITPLDNNDKFLTPNVKIFDTNKTHKPPTALNILRLQYWHCDC